MKKLIGLAMSLMLLTMSCFSVYATELPSVKVEPVEITDEIINFLDNHPNDTVLVHADGSCTILNPLARASWYIGPGEIIFDFTGTVNNTSLKATVTASSSSLEGIWVKNKKTSTIRNTWRLQSWERINSGMYRGSGGYSEQLNGLYYGGIINVSSANIEVYSVSVSTK